MNEFEFFHRVLDRWLALQHARLDAVLALWGETVRTRSIPPAPKPALPAAGHFVRGTGRLWPETTLKISPEGSYVIPAIKPVSAQERELERATEWAASALNFPLPLGLIFLHYIDPL